MDVTEDVTLTLRAQAHHPPCITESAGFCTEHSADSRSIGYGQEVSPTLRAGSVPAAVYENHGQDTRFNGPLDTAPAVIATYGTGDSEIARDTGGNSPDSNQGGVAVFMDMLQRQQLHEIGQSAQRFL